MLIPLETAGLSPTLSVLSHALWFNTASPVACGFTQHTHISRCTSENLWLGRRAADRCLRRRGSGPRKGSVGLLVAVSL